MLVGFENGDIILLDAISMAQKSKYNVNAALNASRVTDVEWLPGSKTQFVAVCVCVCNICLYACVCICALAKSCVIDVDWLTDSRT